MTSQGIQDQYRYVRTSLRSRVSDLSLEGRSASARQAKVSKGLRLRVHKTADEDKSPEKTSSALEIPPSPNLIGDMLSPKA